MRASMVQEKSLQLARQVQALRGHLPFTLGVLPHEAGNRLDEALAVIAGLGVRAVELGWVNEIDLPELSLVQAEEASAQLDAAGLLVASAGTGLFKSLTIGGLVGDPLDHGAVRVELGRLAHTLR